MLKNKCDVEIPISPHHIILGSDMLDCSINLFIALIKYYRFVDFLDKKHMYQV
jgi:hypothetical protein